MGPYITPENVEEEEESVETGADQDTDDTIFDLSGVSWEMPTPDDGDELAALQQLMANKNVFVKTGDVERPKKMQPTPKPPPPSTEPLDVEDNREWV